MRRLLALRLAVTSGTGGEQGGGGGADDAAGAVRAVEVLRRNGRAT